MKYRAVLKPDSNDTILVSFPDLPGAISFGADRDEALARGRDALISIIEALINHRKPIPMPTEGRGSAVYVPALLEAKIALHNEMLAQSVNKSELGRRLDQHLPQIDRLVDVRHGSQLDQLEAAFEALGKRLTIRVEDSPGRKPAPTKMRPRRLRRPNVDCRRLR